MAEDIEQRVAAAAERVREHDLTAQRLADLTRRRDAMAAELEALRANQAEEQRDVERLEGMSLTRILVSLRGARDDTLDRERAEAEAARYRVAEGAARLAAVVRECEAAAARLRELVDAPAAYAAALDERERFLRASGDPRGRRLLELAEERGRRSGEGKEIAEARAAARRAWEALSQVQESLNSASGWSTYDTFFGGGALSSSVKHHRLDEAARQAAHADHCLLALRTELADVGGGLARTAPTLQMDGLTRFVDVWFDNFFTDLAVRDRIKRAQGNVAHSMDVVREVSGQLKQRDADIRARLTTIEDERRRLLVAD